jgi:hypothetical protein
VQVLQKHLQALPFMLQQTGAAYCCRGAKTKSSGEPPGRDRAAAAPYRGCVRIASSCRHVPRWPLSGLNTSSVS